MYENITKCNFDKTGMFMLRVTPDARSILIFMGAPFRSKEFWQENKGRVADAFLARVKEYLPGLRDHIVYFEAATPATLQRYTLNAQGASFGWAKLPEQTFDPILSKTTFLDGLYLTGHWTSIAFGMPGACYAGDDTAKRILRKHGRRGT
jgi:phytoene dehydrogenase-like protein